MIREEEFALSQRRLGEMIQARIELVEKFQDLGLWVDGNPELEKAYEELDAAWDKLIRAEAKFLIS